MSNIFSLSLRNRLELVESAEFKSKVPQNIQYIDAE